MCLCAHVHEVIICNVTLEFGQLLNKIYIYFIQV